MNKLPFYIITAMMGYGGLIVFGVRGCNSHYNDRRETKTGYELVSFPQGLDGHTECIFYDDHSLDIRVEEPFSNEKVTFIQDLDGDGRADRIRVQGSKAKSHALESLLMRKYDLEANHPEFEDADNVIQKCLARR